MAGALAAIALACVAGAEIEFACAHARARAKRAAMHSRGCRASAPAPAANQGRAPHRGSFKVLYRGNHWGHAAWRPSGELSCNLAQGPWERACPNREGGVWRCTALLRRRRAAGTCMRGEGRPWGAPSDARALVRGGARVHVSGQGPRQDRSLKSGARACAQGRRGRGRPAASGRRRGCRRRRRGERPGLRERTLVVGTRRKLET